MKVEVETVHSQEPNSGFEIRILNTITNRLKTQVIIIQDKETTVEYIFNYKRIYIDQRDIIKYVSTVKCY